jgi:hypothetical protein
MAVGGIQQSTKKGTMETVMPLSLAAGVVAVAAAAAWLGAVLIKKIKKIYQKLKFEVRAP